MPILKIKPPTIPVKLEKYDPTGETIAVVRQIPQLSFTRLAGLFSKRVERILDNGLIVENVVEWNGEELRAERVYESLVGLNLYYEDGKPVFEFGEGADGPEPARRDKFFKVWNRLTDRTLIEDLYNAAKQANPEWEPERAGE